ncbi:hypothetical protein F383_08325 [Gossypium arboreum]|uniref:Uncharacterized protein n=1 Tax=Gossypium arboreum TaxID=29729 RepID=A0A0B0NGW4_GOSAR|nr:hypothetical protein F383_08325 [Gossypium arboreum]
MSKGTKIKFHSVVTIFDDPQAPDSYDIYKTMQTHTK